MAAHKKAPRRHQTLALPHDLGLDAASVGYNAAGWDSSGNLLHRSWNGADRNGEEHQLCIPHPLCRAVGNFVNNPQGKGLFEVCLGSAYADNGLDNTRFAQRNGE